MDEVKRSPAYGVDDRRATRRLALYIIVTLLASCFMLVFNVGMVYSLYSSIAIVIPENISKQVGQLILLFGPFVLLFPEWMLYDVLVASFRRWR